MKNKRISERKTSDFGARHESHTIILKRTVWRIELSGAAIGRFFRHHKLVIIASLAVLVTAGIVTRYILVGFADTADFYPSSCLGNWENVQNALGKPDLPPGSPASAFTTFNSAVMGTSTAQMFCGNFNGDTDINTLTGKSFQSADLVLSWSFAFPPEPATGSDAGNASGTVGIDESSSGTATSTMDSSSTINVSDTTVSATSTVAPSVSGRPPADSSTPSDSNATTTSELDASATTLSATSTLPPAPADSSTSVTPPQAASSSDSTNSDSTSQDSTPASPATDPSSMPVSTPASTPVAPTPDTSAPSADPTSWLHNLISVAYADENDTSSLAIDTSTVSSSDDSSTIASDTPYVQSGTSSLPTAAPISVNTAAFQNIAIPSSTGDAVLSIVYSTDGVTWQPLVNIDAANWQQGRYPIPISSWVELQHLQIAFVGLGASSTPPIFLDAAGVEVSYVDAPQPQPDATTTPDIAQPDSTTDAPPTAGSVMPPAPTEIPPAQAFKQVFDPFAGQQCSITPFSESITAGAGGSFLLKMIPPRVATSSTSGTHAPASAAKTPFLYDASIGSLPDGITATIIFEGAGMEAIGVTTAATVLPGSYNVVVVYKERQNDGSIAPNFCQFNLVITPASS